MSKQFKRISISEDTDRILITKVRDEMIRHHPELKNMPMSRNYIIQYIAEFYIES